MPVERGAAKRRPRRHSVAGKTDETAAKVTRVAVAAGANRDHTAGTPGGHANTTCPHGRPAFSVLGGLLRAESGGRADLQRDEILLGLGGVTQLRADPAAEESQG